MLLIFYAQNRLFELELLRSVFFWVRMIVSVDKKTTHPYQTFCPLGSRAVWTCVMLKSICNSCFFSPAALSVVWQISSYNRHLAVRYRAFLQWGSRNKDWVHSLYPDNTHPCFSRACASLARVKGFSGELSHSTWLSTEWIIQKSLLTQHTTHSIMRPQLVLQEKSLWCQIAV